MVGFFALLIRLFAITFGFLCGCVTASVSYIFLSGLIRPDDFSTYSEVEMAITLIITIASLTTYFASLTFIPFAILVFLFEIRSIRDWLIYILAAALISILSPVLFFSPAADLTAASLYTVSAMLGGLIYWLFVGQRAGNWRRK